MMIKSVSLSGYNFHEVNSDYLFEEGLNFIVGEHARGKTTILNSIISGFTTETYQEHWIHPPLESNQEPIITIEFKYQETTYCFTKKIKKDGIDCQLYIINEQRDRSLISEGAEAIERVKQYSMEIISFISQEFGSALEEFSGHGYGYRNHLEIFGIDDQSLPEFLILLNKFLAKYDRYEIWKNYKVTIVGGYIKIIDLDGTPVPYPAIGTIQQMFIMSLVASIRMREKKPVLILDEWGASIDNEYTEFAFIPCFRELGSQVILAKNFMPIHNLEDNMIKLNR